MELLASLLVGKPQNILVVSIVFLTSYLMLRFAVPGLVRNSRPLLIVSIAWVLYSAWELLVQTKTPEANIRIDLLVIWPVLAILSAWAVFRVFR
jgi:hypothetical protein